MFDGQKMFDGLCVMASSNNLALSAPYPTYHHINDEGYWCFNVLVPSKSNTFNMIYYKVNCFILETNQLPSTLLMDYSCYDNLVKDLLPNSMAHNCLNYAQVIKGFIGRHNNNVEEQNHKFR